jgi:hypothetical protein
VKPCLSNTSYICDHIQGFKPGFCRCCGECFHNVKCNVNNKPENLYLVAELIAGNGKSHAAIDKTRIVK